ncbi:putative Co/Zn/Cd efflux system membrane fusion protein [Flavobacterium saliperosum S13]|uniref:Membrane fusion protein, multidrug efflux system n=2 Tax=Flavobacterium saliperosum TaxID=329186 RepID=A0A1G4V5N3_9FLAO|nr:efflux RND transporter periplasmic adaptor subunit [Flavobacterium saliperosum]ESU27866.1 putative Co/Zn/Cd efflux system membrane fusion protein [Flavobacterium saliperosum S13]SCX01614.1 membrane fusion protein, multidrug efflux system [Flavobacterium saliperosum]
MKFKYIIYFALAVVLGGMIFYRISENSAKEENGKGKGGGGDKRPAKVTGIVLKPQVFSDNLSLSGSIDANEQVEIRSEVSGIVESINFEEGTVVAKGQQLLKINDLELRAQLSQARTRQTLASENERRARLLLQKEAISQEEYDIASADFRSAQAQTQLIQAQIAKTSVKAPFSGKIGLRSISKGTYVTPTTVIANLVNTTQVKITFSIPEKYATQMKINTLLSFTVAGSKEQFSAKIYAIEPGIEVATRTLKMRAIAQNPNGKLIPGTFANVALPLEKINDALLVPTEALIPVQNGKKVFVSVNGKAKEVMVETGARTDKDVLVLTGLKPGDTVLTSGVMTLKDDSPVKVTLK